MLSHPDYNSSSSLKEFMDAQGFTMQKKFGQNFLTNGNARKTIIDALDVNENTSVWEVGPGLGCMTEEILSRGSDLTVFEIDKGFAGLLPQFFETYADKDKFRLVQGDVLKTWKKQLKEAGKTPDRFFGNLPYNIAATLIADTIEEGIRFDKCVFTIQKEVAKRMTAKPGSDDYSSFTVLCSWAYDIKPVIDLGPNNFWPRPNVDSRAVLFTKKENFPDCENPALFAKMQRALFVSRRKTVKNNLDTYLKSSELSEQVLNAAGVDPKARAETLSVETLLKLSDCLNRITK